MNVLESAPPLAWLVALAGVFDVMWNHVGVVALDTHEEGWALWLLRTGTFWRNLGAIAGLVTIVVGFFTYFRMAGFAKMPRRLQLAGLTGLLLPALLLATFSAKDELMTGVVFVAVGVGNAIVVLLGIAVGGYHRSPYRGPFLGVVTVSVLVLLLFVTTSFEQLGILPPARSGAGGLLVWGIAASSRIVAEITWVILPLIVLRRVHGAGALSPRSRAVLFAGLGLTAVVVVLLEALGHRQLALVLYGAFRVGLLPERAAALYVLPIGAGLAIGLAAIVSSDSRVRALGLHVLLWIAAGFAPQTPIQVVYLVVGTLALARVVQATDPEGRRRADLAWGEPITPPPPTGTAVALAPFDRMSDPESEPVPASETTPPASESAEPAAREAHEAAREAPEAERDAPEVQPDAPEAERDAPEVEPDAPEAPGVAEPDRGAAAESISETESAEPGAR